MLLSFRSHGCHMITVTTPPLGASVAEELTGLFAEELNPVAVKAQRKVPVPEGLVSKRYLEKSMYSHSC